jgi:hypothetical protein
MSSNNNNNNVNANDSESKKQFNDKPRNSNYKGKKFNPDYVPSQSKAMNNNNPSDSNCEETKTHHVNVNPQQKSKGKKPIHVAEFKEESKQQSLNVQPQIVQQTIIQPHIVPTIAPPIVKPSVVQIGKIVLTSFTDTSANIVFDNIEELTFETANNYSDFQLDLEMVNTYTLTIDHIAYDIVVPYKLTESKTGKKIVTVLKNSLRIISPTCTITNTRDFKKEYPNGKSSVLVEITITDSITHQSHVFTLWPFDILNRKHCFDITNITTTNNVF